MLPDSTLEPGPTFLVGRLTRRHAGIIAVAGCVTAALLVAVSATQAAAPSVPIMLTTLNLVTDGSAVQRASAVNPSAIRAQKIAAPKAPEIGGATSAAHEQEMGSRHDDRPVAPPAFRYVAFQAAQEQMETEAVAPAAAKADSEAVSDLRIGNLTSFPVVVSSDARALSFDQYIIEPGQRPSRGSSSAPTWSELTGALHCMVDELEGRHKMVLQALRDRGYPLALEPAATSPIHLNTALTVLKSLVYTHLAEANASAAGFSSQDWLLDGLLSTVDVAKVSYARRQWPITSSGFLATFDTWAARGQAAPSLDGRNWLRPFRMVGMRGPSRAVTHYFRFDWLPYCKAQRRMYQLSLWWKDLALSAPNIFRRNYPRRQVRQVQIEGWERGHPDGL